MKNLGMNTILNKKITLTNTLQKKFFSLHEGVVVVDEQHVFHRNIDKSFHVRSVVVQFVHRPYYVHVCVGRSCFHGGFVGGGF